MALDTAASASLQALPLQLIRPPCFLGRGLQAHPRTGPAFVSQRRLITRPCVATQQALATSGPAAPAVECQGDKLRSDTAQHILDILEGNHLSDKDLERELHNALRVLPVRVLAPRAWHSVELAVAEAGKAGFSHALAPRWHTIPPFHTTADCGCCIASSHRGRRFKAKELNMFSALLFECLPAAVQVAGLPKVQLNRFDLHHAHIFLSCRSGRLGMLFHCQEYPAHHPEDFPVRLGNCQQGSSVDFDTRAMDFRNILWYDGNMCSLDVGKGSVLHERLLMDGLQGVRTVLESDFGAPLADLYYLHELLGRRPRHRVFVCVPGT